MLSQFISDNNSINEGVQASDISKSRVMQNNHLNPDLLHTSDDITRTMDQDSEDRSLIQGLVRAQ